jgi:hypothetical protein
MTVQWQSDGMSVTVPKRCKRLIQSAVVELPVCNALR